MKRLFPIVLVLLLITAALTACGDSSAPVNDTTAPDAATTAPAETEAPKKDHVIVENGTANYKIIRTEDATQSIIDAVISLKNMIETETGTALVIGTDWIKPGAEYNHESYEILIGQTGYSESAEALADLAYGDFVITSVGNKLVVNAYSDAGLTNALRELKVLIRQGGEQGSLVIPADTHEVQTYVASVNKLPTYENGNVTNVYHVGEENYLILVENTTLDAHKAYLQKLEGDGYALYTENQIVDNLFSTYKNDKYIVTASYLPSEEQTRLILEPMAPLPDLKEENKYTTLVSTPTVAQLGLESNGNKNGMSYVIQLADGSYIIIDGGFQLDSDVKQLYDYMYDNAPDKNNIVIAAWFLTHSHGDHTGAFLKFSQSSYAKKVKLEKVIGAFVGDESLTTLLDATLTKASEIKAAAGRFSGAEYVRAHAGQKYYLRDAEIEMLYTIESLFPAPLERSNSTSLVFTVNIGGQRLLFFGDATNNAIGNVVDLFGDYIKSDFVQTAHHGYAAGDKGTKGIKSGYELSAPTVVLWPVGFADYDMVIDTFDYNKLLAQRLASVKEIIVAGDRDVVLKLPYTAGTSGYETILKTESAEK